MTKTKYWLSLLAISVVLVAGSLAMSPIAIAGDDDDDDDNEVSATERDNVIVHSITLTNGERMVIVDNAGIGQTSDVEMTWRFDATKCKLQVATVPAGMGFGLTDIADDGAVGGNPAHRDWVGAEGVILTTVGDATCTIDDTIGEYVGVSTVASNP